MLKISLLSLVLLVSFSHLDAQRTRIMGFADLGVDYRPNTGKASFVMGEQDLFITSDITDKISFLSETVLKFSGGKFAVGLERAIIKYNYKGNHMISIGRFHTPVNYWNDSYHHGRVFFPTIGRPETFNEHIIPIHNLGIRMAAANLGELKFGYDILVGNGIGSNPLTDNDKHKSYTIAAHIKPFDGYRFGASAYFDKITAGSSVTGATVSQAVYSGSFAMFKKFELLAEYSYASNSAYAVNDSIGAQGTHALYVYMGYRIKDMIIPYFRFDYLEFGEDEMFFDGEKTNGYTVGVRYEVNYLTSLKLEYGIKQLGFSTIWDQSIKFQVALGFNYYD